eukprot:evm.model.NODE_34004_length_5754_cov_35.989223.1
MRPPRQDTSMAAHYVAAEARCKGAKRALDQQKQPWKVLHRCFWTTKKKKESGHGFES